jgi:hypothetical protein
VSLLCWAELIGVSPKYQTGRRGVVTGGAEYAEMQLAAQLLYQAGTCSLWCCYQQHQDGSCCMLCAVSAGSSTSVALPQQCCTLYGTVPAPAWVLEPTPSSNSLQAELRQNPQWDVPV